MVVIPRKSRNFAAEKTDVRLQSYNRCICWAAEFLTKGVLTILEEVG